MSSDNKGIIPYGRQTITEADIAAVVEVLRSPFLTQGSMVPAFEHAVANKVGARHGVAVNSATSALHIACLALGLGPGDRLWTSPITFVASANCARYCAADVDFVDIEPSTGLMSVAALAAKLDQAEREGTLPKVVVPVHLTGSSCDMAAIGALAKRFGFAVLEDASHAIGGCYRGRPVGSCQYSDITVFSFHPVKIITTGEGGMAVTNDPLLAQEMMEFRSHGIVRDTQRFVHESTAPWMYEQQRLGFNYRLTDFQAALGLSQLKKLDEIVVERNLLLQNYRELFSGLPVKLLEVPKDVISSVHLAVIRIQNISVEEYNKLFDRLRSAGIGVQLHYNPVHLQPYYRELGFAVGQFSIAEIYAKTSLSIPLYPGLKYRDQRLIVESIRSILEDLRRC